MREIKFRAWDKKEKQMVFGVPFHRDNTGVFEIMQFTGIKNEDGKEIYEGDILKWNCQDDFDDYFICELKNQRWLVNIKDNGWGDIFPDMEIIGNIYENPELLDALQKDSEVADGA